jgi:hypothetical protein
LVFGKEPLVPKEELPDFLNALSYFWDEGLSAKQIAKEMRFGEPQPHGWPNLKPEHVYYFAEKYAKEYGFKPRKKMTKKMPPGYVKYDPNLPDSVIEIARREGVLWDDPEEKPTAQK